MQRQPRKQRCQEWSRSQYQYDDTGHAVLRCPVDGRVTGVDPGHHQALVAGAGVERFKVLQGDRGGVDELSALLVTGNHVGMYQAGGPDDDVGGFNDPSAAHTHQVWGTRSGSNENDLAGSFGDVTTGHRRRLDDVVV